MIVFAKGTSFARGGPQKTLCPWQSPSHPAAPLPRVGAPSPGSAISRYVLPSRTSSLSGSLMLLPVLLLAISGWMGRFQVMRQRLDKAAKDFQDLPPSLPFLLSFSSFPSFFHTLCPTALYAPRKQQWVKWTQPSSFPEPPAGQRRWQRK